MNDYEQICKLSKELSTEQQQKVLQYIQQLQSDCQKNTDLPEDTQVSGKKAAPPCPYCGDEQVIRFGRKEGKQRYKCKACSKLFMATSRTIMEKSHSDEESWRIVIQDTLSGKVSLDETAEKIGVSHPTAFHMRHKVLMAIEKQQEEAPVVLQDISELDETYVLESQKGTKFSDDASRKPRKHGATALTRGVSEEQVCIMAGVQRNGGPAYATTMNRAHPSKEEIESAFKDHVGAGCVAFTDGLKGYKHLEGVIDCVVESVSVKDQKNRGTANLNNVNGFHSHIKERYRQYRGVATKYINRYNALFCATYRADEELSESVYAELSRTRPDSCPITCSDVHTKGLLEI